MLRLRTFAAGLFVGSVVVAFNLVSGVRADEGGAKASAAKPTRDVPLGHRDFYPSDERPVGFRGDGNGGFPGATPVTVWREGDAEQKKMKLTAYNSGSPHVRVQERRVWTFTNDKRANIVWKTEMPGYSNSSAIVVGDRVFCMADPHTLVCVDVHTGKILWQRDNNPFEFLGLPQEEVKRLTELMEITQAVHAIKGSITGNYGRLPSKYKEEYREPWIRQIQVIRRLGERALAIDSACGAEKLLGSVEEILKGIEALTAETANEQCKALAGKIARLHDHLENPMRKLYGFYVTDHWAGMVGLEFATPTSDGRYVYVSIGQGQVACYDLNGNRVWARHVKVKQNWYDFVRLGQVPSPLLIGDVLVVQQVEKLMGLEKRTGKVLWESPDICVRKTYNVGSHKALRLRRGGIRRDVIVTTHGKVLDAATGEVVAELPHEDAHIPNEATPAVMGNDAGLVCLYLGAVNATYRLTLTPSGDVEARRLAIFKAKWNNGTSLILDGDRIIAVVGRQAGVYDASAKRLAEFEGFGGGYSGIGPILAGNYVIGLGGVGSPYGREREDELIVVECPVVDLADPLKPKVIQNQNFLGGLNKPRLPHLEKHAPELYAAAWYGPLEIKRRGLWAMEAIPPQFGHAGPFAQGNRIFIRSCSHLYCIGDPKVPYDWNPASRPKPIADKLKTSAGKQARHGADERNKEGAGRS